MFFLARDTGFVFIKRILMARSELIDSFSARAHFLAGGFARAYGEDDLRLILLKRARWRFLLGAAGATERESEEDA